MRCPSCGNHNRPEARFCDACGAPLGAEPAAAPAVTEPTAAGAPGLIAGRYRVERFLGHGGRKRVYVAADAAEAGREVAVAVFETADVGETVRARLRREAQAMERLGRHPRIVPVLASGEEDDSAHVVSELMSGGDVDELLAAAPGRRLAPERAIAIARDVCEGLEHAHGRGVVHRDLKPANVFFGEDGRARIGDFGLAATGGRSRAAVEGLLVGTVAYLPPEQALGRSSDARADLYSLGAMLYEMLTGQPPFPGDDAVAIISRHLNAEPVAPRRHEPAVPPGLERLVLELLAKRPAERPPSAAAVRERLERLAAGEDAEPPAAGAEPGRENPLESMAGGVFVGRERELDEMRSAYEDALGGRGSILLLVGEPGVGKTRTAEELATYAQLRGARVHWGHGHEGEAAPAFWPWTEALRSFVRASDPVGLRWETGSSLSELVRLAPELAAALGEPAAEPAPAGEQARFRLFDGVAGFLAAASRSRPLVIVLDDLHWADASSLELLKFVSRQLTGTGLLVVGTYRDVEVGRHHPLGRTLAELGAQERCRRLQLHGLDERSVERFIEISAGVDPAPGLAERIWEQTEGNPFFVGEVIRLLLSEGRLEPQAGERRPAIPEGVRDVVGRRLDRLSDEANELLRVAAVAGRRFERAIVERVSGRPPGDVETALGEAVAERLVNEASAPGRYSFTHAIVRETLYEEIPIAGRVELNRRIGEAVEEIHADDLDAHLDWLAMHFIEAAPAAGIEKAIDYAERAASAASTRLAYEDAAGHLARALDALELADPADTALRLRLGLELGAARHRAGRLAEAREAYEKAAALARQRGDRDALARAAIGATDVVPVGFVDEPLTELLREAIAALGDERSGRRSELLSALSSEIYWRDPQGEARALSEEAIELAREVGDDRALVMALARRQFLFAGSADAVERRRQNAGEMLALARRLGDRELELRAHVYLLVPLLELGEIEAADAELEAYTRIATELRQPQHLWHVPVLGAMRATMAGHFAEAERLAGEARRAGERAQEPLAEQFGALQLAVIRRHQGKLEEALPAVRKMASAFPAIKAWRMALASFLAELGKLDEARAEFEAFAANGFRDVPVDAQWAAAMIRLAETCAWLGDRPRAELLLERLAVLSGQAVVAGRGASCQGPADHYAAALLLVLDRPGEALERWSAALELARRMGDRPMVLEARLGIARAAAARGGPGDRRLADEELVACLEGGQELGMRRLVERALTLRLELRGLAEVDVRSSIEAVIAAVESERPDLSGIAAADGTVTIVFTDIEDSTLINERLGDARWLEVLRAHNEVFRRNLARLGGYEVKSQGDGFMLAFADPAAALEFALATQAELGAAPAAGEQVRVRMGVHTGVAIHEGGDLFGRSVVLAARIAARAAGGEVLVSEASRERAGERFGEAFDGGRELELKGLAGSHRVFALAAAPAASPAR